MRCRHPPLIRGGKKMAEATMKRFSRFLYADPRALTLLTLPAVVLFSVFVVFPIISGLNISFTNWNGYSQSYSYVGLQNYLDVFSTESVWIAFRNTLVYGFGSTLVQTVLGLGLAMLLVDKFFLRNVTRTIVYIPAMVAQLVIGYIWYFIVTYERGGALNDIIQLFGGVAPVDWMSKGSRAVLIIMLINSIAYCGKTMIIFIAGLESVPNMYHEAASIDGASGWQSFRHITIPLLLPAFTTSLVLNIIGGLKMFGLVIAMTDGGPGYASHSLSSLINTMYFANQRAGFSAAIGIFSFIFIMLVSILLRRYLDHKDQQYNG